MLKMRHPFFVVLILSMMIFIINCDVQLKTKFEWKYINFTWDENSETSKEAMQTYNATNCFLLDVDQDERGRYFVTSIRDEGVPASLMTVSNRKGDGGPLLSPYPEWSWHNESDCNSIISVYRVDIKCNRLFVLDCGQIGIEQVCPPKLMIFDLSNDKLIKQVPIPHDVSTNANGTGILVTPAVYAKHNCENIENTATVFMADITGFGLVMYDAINSQFCRIESDYMRATNTDFTIQNESFSLDDGILGLTLINKGFTTYLYYSDLAGNEVYKMDVRKLKCPLTTNEAYDLTDVAGTLSGQTAPIASKECVLFFSNIPKTSIMCADSCRKFNPSENTDLVAYNPEKLQFPGGMKVRKDTLMTLTNRFQKIMNDNLNLNETNYRVLTISIPEIRKKTRCFSSCKPREGKHKENFENDVCYCKKESHGHHGHHGRPWPNWG